MNWRNAQILNLPNEAIEAEPSTAAHDLLLEWVADNPILKTRIHESTLDVAQSRYFRFAIEGTDAEGEMFRGFGRSRDRRGAAVIASAEMLERLVAKKVLKTNDLTAARHGILFKNGEIEINESAPCAMPSQGLHSSNGWAVHFSLQAAIERAALEALERHILLYTYLKDGWEGFDRDHQVVFEHVTLFPLMSRNEIAGFRAGMVYTKGQETGVGALPGVTFGYLCDESTRFLKSTKWLNAFFESYEQWIDVERLGIKDTDSWIERYQRHYLEKDRLSLAPTAPHTTELHSIKQAHGHLMAFDLAKALHLPCSLYAAFVFGGDLIPLFLKQRLTKEEGLTLMHKLIGLGIAARLPEFHPIL